MQSETLPAPAQPAQPPHVTPCHTGPAARVCGFDAALNERDVDTAELLTVTRGFCEFRTFGGAA